MFNKIKIKTLRYKTSELPNTPINEFILPALTAGIKNQGLNNYVPKNNVTILKNVISISANGANTGATFYQSKDFTVLQDAYAIKWKNSADRLTDAQYIFLVGSISKTIFGNYEWTNKAGWERIKNNYIKLPTKNNEIDFDFMESFIAELEAEHVAELSAYLKASGLNNYELSDEEKKALETHNNLKFKEYDIIKLFEVKNTSNILSRDIAENSGTTPYLCASVENNAVKSYITYNKQFLEKGNCIFIGGKTFVVTYQEKDFYSNDSHNLSLYLKVENPTKANQLYLATSIYKSLHKKYSWGNSISNNKIKSDKILLPILNGEVNFDFMETFISAIQKLVIKDAVLYSKRKIAATKEAIKQQ